MSNQLLSTRNKPISTDLYRGLGCVRQLLSRALGGPGSRTLTDLLSLSCNITAFSRLIENRAAALDTTRHALKTLTFETTELRCI